VCVCVCVSVLGEAVGKEGIYIVFFYLYNIYHGMCFCGVRFSKNVCIFLSWRATHFFLSSRRAVGSIIFHSETSSPLPPALFFFFFV